MPKLWALLQYDGFVHQTSFDIGKLFLAGTSSTLTKVLEVGSYNVNGGLREEFPGRFTWTGLDLVSGPGVDVVANDPYVYPFEDDSFDICVSSSTFEHDSFFWLTFLEVSRVLRPGGLFYINLPSNGYVHRFPLDIWRFYPDAGIALRDWASRNNLTMNLIESLTAEHGKEIWNDFVAVFQKDLVSEPPRLYKAIDCRNVRYWDPASNEVLVLLDSAETQQIEESAFIRYALKQKYIRSSTRQFIRRVQAWLRIRKILN